MGYEENDVPVIPDIPVIPGIPGKTKDAEGLLRTPRVSRSISIEDRPGYYLLLS